MRDGSVRVDAALSPATTRVERILTPGGLTVSGILERVDGALARSPGTRVFLDGDPVPRERWSTVVPAAGSVVLVRVVPCGDDADPGGDKVLRTVLMIAITASALAVGGPWGAAIAIGGYFAVDELVPLPQLQTDAPDGAASAGADALRRTPALSGARNSLSPYGPVPIVLGKHRITPPLGAQPYTELDQSDQFLRMVMIPGYGPLALFDPRIGETPLGSFSEVQMQTQQGTASDTALSLYPKTVVEESPGVLLKSTTGWVTRRTQEDVDEIGVEITFPRGLVYLAPDGRKIAAQVNVEAQYKEIGAGSWSVMGDVLDVPAQYFYTTMFSSDAYGLIVVNKRSGRVWVVSPTASRWLPADDQIRIDNYVVAWVRASDFAGILYITDARDPALTQYGAGHFQPTNTPDSYWVSVAAGKLDVTGLSAAERSAATIRKGVVIKVDRGQYDVRLWRSTPDSTDDALLDEVYWTALRSISTEDPVSLPNVAKVALRIRATEQLQGVVDQFNIIAQSIMLDWDGETSAWIERPTSNPASIYRRLLQGPMNKRPVADARIDLPALQAWHEWCEANGHEFNGVINFSTTLLQLLRDVASVGRASPTMRDGLFSVVQDVAQSVPRQLFTPKNSWGFAASRGFADLPHGIKAQFVNGLPTHEMTVTPANVQAGDVFKVKFGTVVLASYPAGAATVADVTAGLKAAWDASSERIASFYDATDAATHLALVSNRASAEYALTGETVNGGGADDQTLTVVTTSGEGTWERDEIVVYDDGYDASNATKFEEVSLLGVANSDQAWRVGRYHLAVARLRPEIYTLHVDVEHIVCNRGNLVRVQHDVPLFGLSSGRVKSRTTAGGNVTTITLDETVTMAGGSSYAVRYRQEDMTIRLENVDTDAGENATLTFAAPVLIAEAPAVGDLVSFGEQGSETVEMIVHQIEMGPELTAKLTLVDAAPAVHAADTGAIPAYDPQVTVAPNLRNLAPAVPEIVSLRSGEAVMVRHKDGTFENRILATIRAGSAGAVPAARFDAQFKLSDKLTWTSLPDATADATEFSVTPVEDGEAYDFRVRAVSQWGVQSAWDAALDHTVLGAMELGTDYLKVLDAALSLAGGSKGNAVVDGGVLFTPVDTEETWAEHFSSRGWADIQDQIDAGYPYYAQPTRPAGGQSNELPDPAEAALAGAWLGAGVQGAPDDWSRAGDDMTAVGGPTYRPVAGVTLDGSSQYLVRSEAEWNADDATGTIAAMVRRSAGYSFDTIFCSGDEGGGDVYFTFIIKGDDNKLEVRAVYGGGGGEEDSVYGSTTLLPDTWYHVAVVSDGITYKLYVDGQPETLTVDRGTNSGRWLSGVSGRDNVTIGARKVDVVAPSYFFGDIKDVRYYSARALTAAQVLTLATGGRGAWEATVDLGGTVYYSKIKSAITLSKIDGVVVVTPSLSVSPDGAEWTDYVGSSEINVTGYRYVRARYDFVAEDGISFVGVSNVQLEIDARTRIDSALVALASGDSGGTEVSFGITFLRVVAVVVTPSGVDSLSNDVNFDFSQDNPTTFKVLMFDEAGVRRSGDATYVARGY